MKTRSLAMVGLTLAMSGLMAAAQSSGTNDQDQPSTGGAKATAVALPGGQDRGPGLGNGTGPRAQLDLCPLVNAQTATGASAPAVRGPDSAASRGWGRGGWGLRNGTGPRARMGLCPLVNGSPTVAPPTATGRGLITRQGFGRGRGWGRGNGWGLRDDTGPQASNRTCPLVNPTPSK